MARFIVPDGERGKVVSITVAVDVYLPFEHAVPLNIAKLTGDYFNNKQMRGELYDVLHLFRFLMLAVTRNPENRINNQKAGTNRKLEQPVSLYDQKALAAGTNDTLDS
jgi:hypothetical protein